MTACFRYVTEFNAFLISCSIQVIAAEAKKLLHTSNVYHNEWAGKLAELLVTLTQREGGLGWAAGVHQPPSENPAQDPSIPVGEPGAKVFFANTGTEANEGALKIARKIGKARGGHDKIEIVCFENAFHGRSLGALSVTPNSKYQDPFAPLLPGVRVGQVNNYEIIESLINDKTCAVIVEPIQGEGGCTAAEVAWLQALRKKCNETGAVLIFDEIQVSAAITGMLAVLIHCSVACIAAVRYGRTQPYQSTAIRTSLQWRRRLEMAIRSARYSCATASRPQ
jgi:acetylornithine aminotransferase